MKLFVGNLSYEVTDEDLRQAFAPFGDIQSVTVVRDMYTQRSKGFGFVEMPARAQAETAMGQLNGTEVKGRPINVSEARPRPDSRGGRGQSSGQRGGGGRRGW
ncbi:MAG: RNA-binding protein [Candidatus Omnitrophica bacterium]|nr:RNA-binding protein [Candidatus Omnitrophota bacterium]